MHQEVGGDFEIVAQLAELQSVEQESFAGLMAREGLSDRSRFATVGTLGGQQIAFRQRTVPFGSAGGFASPAKGVSWLKLARVQNAIAGFVSEDGQTWTLVDFTSIGSTHRIQVGPVVDSGARDVLTTAEFRSVSVKPISGPFVATNLTKPLLRIVSEPAPSGANDAIQILVASPPGTSYVVEASDTFAAWQAVGTLTNHYGIVGFNVPASPGQTRFFRMRDKRSQSDE